LGKSELIFGREADDMRILDGSARRLLGGVDHKIAHAAAFDLGGAPDHRQSLGRETSIDASGALC
jgi:hypothetical protein